MKTHAIVLSSFFLLTLSVLFSCGKQQTVYEKMVEKELASGVRNDSLFLGVHFGMSSKDFFAHCWQLNKKGLVIQGGGNNTVEYILPDDSFEHGEGQVDFYPNFHEGKVQEIQAKFAYLNWAPWHKHLSQDNLETEVMDLLKRWYGGDFLTVEHPTRGSIHVMVQGNRKIVVRKSEDFKDVKVLFEDLSVGKEPNNELSEK